MRRCSHTGSPTLDDQTNPGPRDSDAPDDHASDDSPTESAPAGSPPLSPSPGTPRPEIPPPGVREQLGATRDAFKSLLDAHVELAKAEFAAIGGQIARAAGLVGCALALLMLVALLVFIGGALFFAEWLLGSLGWGVLHGTILFTGLAFAAVIAILGFGAGRIAGWFGLALLLGIGIAIVLGSHVLNQLYAALGESVLPAVDPGQRTILAGLVTGALVIGVLSIIPAVLVGGAAGFGVFLGGLVGGAALGAFTAITFDWQPAFGVGLTVAYLLWIVFLAVDLFRVGIDDEAIKARFYPNQTIDTTKETLEWLKRRMPRGNES